MGDSRSQFYTSYHFINLPVTCERTIIRNIETFVRLPVEVSAYEVVDFLLGFGVTVLKLVQERVLNVQTIWKHHV